MIQFKDKSIVFLTTKGILTPWISPPLLQYVMSLLSPFAALINRMDWRQLCTRVKAGSSSSRASCRERVCEKWRNLDCLEILLERSPACLEQENHQGVLEMDVSHLWKRTSLIQPRTPKFQLQFCVLRLDYNSPLPSAPSLSIYRWDEHRRWVNPSPTSGLASHFRSLMGKDALLLSSGRDFRLKAGQRSGRPQVDNSGLGPCIC